MAEPVAESVIIEQRQAGHRLFGQPGGAASLLGQTGERLQTDWLALHFTHQALLGRADIIATDEVLCDGLTRIIDRALHMTWFNAEGRGMLSHIGSPEPHLTYKSMNVDI